MGFDVRSSELDIGLQSNDQLVAMEVDTAASKPFPSSQPMILQALKESCSLKEEHVELGTSFNFLSVLEFVFCVPMRKLVFLLMVKFGSTKLTS